MHTTWGRFVCKPSKVHKWFRERKLVKAWPFCFPKALWSTAFLFLLQCLNLFLTPLQRVDSWHAIIFCTPSCSSHFSAQLNARQASGLASCSCSQTYRILGQLAWATQNFIEHFYALVLWPTTLSSIINYTFDLIMFFSFPSYAFLMMIEGQLVVGTKSWLTCSLRAMDLDRSQGSFY